MIELILYMIFAYMLGSISSAIITCKAFKLPDPRTKGSNNPGATNVMRIGGRLPAIITLLGDALKGFIPTIIAVSFGATSSMAALILLAAFLGHLYPIFFGFKGGKGIATTIGGLFVVSPIAGVMFALVWLLVFVVTKISSLSALIATVTMPLVIYWQKGLITATPMVIIAFMIFIKHKTNINRLLNKQEDKV